MMNTNRNSQTNGVNEMETLESQLSPGRQAARSQATADRHPTTGRKIRWTRADNIKLMECYFKSDPTKLGYRQRFYDIYKEEGGYDVTEQNLADRARYINKNRRLLTPVELEEIKRRVTSTTTEQIDELIHDEVTENEREDITAEVEDNEHMVLSVEETIVKDEILQVMEALRDEDKRTRLPKLKRMNRGKVAKETAVVNKVIGTIVTRNITEINDLIYAGAKVVAQRMGAVKDYGNKQSGANKPPWRRRMENDIRQYRKDLARACEMKKGQSIRQVGYLDEKYNIKEKGINHVIEVLKQRIKMMAEKIRRYSGRTEQYKQNRQFSEDEGRFYMEHGRSKDIRVPPPEKEEAKKFWEQIWGTAHVHNRQAEWLKRIDGELSDITDQDDMVIDMPLLRTVLKKLRPWKAAGPDGVQGFWYKRFSSLHGQIVRQFSNILTTGVIPKWMTKGRTVLIPKDAAKGNIPSNFRPITCLPISWKILTGMISENMSQFLRMNDMLPWEQKGCGKGSRGAKEQLLIDKAVLKDCRTRKTNLAMAWIDYRKAYDMVPHTWIKATLEKMKIAKNIRQLLANSMENWSTTLESEGNDLGDVNIKRGIFQGDSLSPLLFVVSLIPLTMLLRDSSPGYVFKNKVKVNHLLYMDDLKLFSKSESDIESLVHTVRIFSEDIGMTFGLDKCALVALKRGKMIDSTRDITMPDGDTISALGRDSEYRYLGILEGDDIKHSKMKEVIWKEYKTRVKSMLKTKLNGGNIIKALNTFAISVIRYSAGIIKWTKAELREADRKTRKLLTLFGGFHPRSDVDRLYVARDKGGRGLMSVEDTVNKEQQQLAWYVNQSQNRVMETIREQLKLGKDQVTDDDNHSGTRESKWKEKPMHGQYPRQIEEISTDSSWLWLTRGHLKRETESLVIAAQDQALRTNYRRAKIEKDGSNPMCRMCKCKYETITHIISGCSKLAQSSYKQRHDKVATALHWGLCKKYDMPHSQLWYNHKPEAVIENEKMKILWDFNIYTDHVMQARRPDIVVVHKIQSECQIIDIAVPNDVGVIEKEDEKISKYQDLAREIEKMWNVRTHVIPIVVGALGTMSERFKEYLALLGTQTSVETVQKTAILGSAHILRKVLNCDS